MGISVFHRETCRLCGGRNKELVLHLEPTPPGDHYVPAGEINRIQETYPLDLFLCRLCGHLELSDVVDPKILYGNYIYETSISMGLVEHYRRYADEVIGRVKPSKNSFIVDIGSNDGTLLRFCQQQGMRVLGIDPAHDIAEKATESGVKTLSAFFTADLAHKIRNEYGPATIVTANNVIANIDNLDDMIKGISVLLDSKGIFVFETGYAVDLVENMLVDNIYHEHLCYYSVKPLESFFRRHGMELIDVQRNFSKGGSLRCTVQLAGGIYSTSPSVAELISLETGIGIDRSEVFNAFSVKIGILKNKIQTLLREIKLQGKTIAAYGASVGVTTLAYYLDLSKLIDFVVDDNPARHNLFTPGYHIPVLSPHIIYERKPDYVLILAWRYSEPIMKKHNTYLKNGGHFIVPLPQLSVISGKEQDVFTEAITHNNH